MIFCTYFIYLDLDLMQVQSSVWITSKEQYPYNNNQSVYVISIQKLLINMDVILLYLDQSIDHQFNFILIQSTLNIWFTINNIQISVLHPILMAMIVSFKASSPL